MQLSHRTIDLLLTSALEEGSLYWIFNEGYKAEYNADTFPFGTTVICPKGNRIALNDGIDEAFAIVQEVLPQTADRILTGQWDPYDADAFFQAVLFQDFYFDKQGKI